METYKLLLVAVMAETLWETCKLLWQGNRINVDKAGAMVLGVFLCLATGVDFFDLAGLPLKYPYVGMVLSGLLVSRGANFVHDLLALLENAKLRMMLPVADHARKRRVSRAQKIRR